MNNAERNKLLSNHVYTELMKILSIILAAKPGFEIFEEAEIEPEQGEIKRQSSRFEI